MKKIKFSKAKVKAKILNIIGHDVLSSRLVVLVKELYYTDINGKSGQIIFDDFTHKVVFRADMTTEPSFHSSMWDNGDIINGDIVEITIENYQNLYLFTSFNVIEKEKRYEGFSGLEELVQF